MNQKDPWAFLGFFLHFLGIYWAFIGHFLGIYWAFSGHFLGIYWAFSPHHPPPPLNSLDFPCIVNDDKEKETQ